MIREPRPTSGSEGFDAVNRKYFGLVPPPAPNRAQRRAGRKANRRKGNINQGARSAR